MKRPIKSEMGPQKTCMLSRKTLDSTQAYMRVHKSINHTLTHIMYTHTPDIVVDTSKITQSHGALKLK